jgi:hypothetical protein
VLYSQAYDSEVDYDNQCLLKILYHFQSFYEIKKTLDKLDQKHYYKTTTNEKLIPNLVYEMSQFISMCASAATVNFVDKKEVEARNLFRTKATSYIQTNFRKYEPKFRASLDKNEFRSVRFSALIQKNNKLNLISYVTGSSAANFRNSIARASMNFEITAHSKYNEYIDNKIVLVNNTADGFVQNQISKQLHVLEEHIGQEPIIWSERERLLSVLN